LRGTDKRPPLVRVGGALTPYATDKPEDRFVSATRQCFAGILSSQLSRVDFYCGYHDMIGNGVQSDPRRAAPHAPEGAGGDREKSGYDPPRPLDGVVQQVRELVEHASLYVEARKDMVRSTVRNLIVKAVLGVIAAIAGITLIVVAVVQLMSGAATGLGLLFGERYWLGELVLATGVFLILAIGAFVGVKLLTKSARERTIKKYERRQQAQRQRFGRSTTERAQELRQSQRS
jgi:hypothetical protein